MLLAVDTRKPKLRSLAWLRQWREPLTAGRRAAQTQDQKQCGTAITKSPFTSQLRAVALYRAWVAPRDIANGSREGVADEDVDVVAGE